MTAAEAWVEWRERGADRCALYVSLGVVPFGLARAEIGSRDRDLSMENRTHTPELTGGELLTHCAPSLDGEVFDEC